MQKFFLTQIRLKIVTLCWLVGVSATAYSAPKTVLILGDSLSAEYGLARGKGWVALLERRIQDKKLDVRIINASISGETTSGGLARLPDLLKQYKPTTTVIELGGNDGLRGLPLSAAEQNFRTMIAQSKAAHASVLLVGMQIPPNYGKNYTDGFASMYPKIAKDTKIALVPFFLAGLTDKLEQFQQADRIHMTAEAHPYMLDNVWPHLFPLIQK